MALPLILHEAHLIWIIRQAFQQTQHDSVLLHRLWLGNDAVTNPLLSLSARPFVCEPDAFRAAYRHTAPQPTLTSPLTLAGTCVSLINLHSVCRFGKLCEEIMFNKWVLFKMIQFHRDLLYAALLLLPNARGFRCRPDLFMQWMPAKACSNAPHILLKMSQGSTACLGFEFPQWPWPWQGLTCWRQPVKSWQRVHRSVISLD